MKHLIPKLIVNFCNPLYWVWAVAFIVPFGGKMGWLSDVDPVKAEFALFYWTLGTVCLIVGKLLSNHILRRIS